MIAEIFPVRQAIGTDPATMAKPGNADTLPGRKSLDLRADLKHFSHNLVPRDDGVAGSDLPVEHMQVRPADTARRHPDEQFIPSWRLDRALVAPQRPARSADLHRRPAAYQPSPDRESIRLTPTHHCAHRIPTSA